MAEKEKEIKLRNPSFGRKKIPSVLFQNLFPREIELFRI